MEDYMQERDHALLVDLGPKLTWPHLMAMIKRDLLGRFVVCKHEGQIAVKWSDHSGSIGAKAPPPSAAVGGYGANVAAKDPQAGGRQWRGGGYEYEEDSPEEEWRLGMAGYLVNKPEVTLLYLSNKVRKPKGCTASMLSALRDDPQSRFELIGQPPQAVRLRVGPGFAGGGGGAGGRPGGADRKLTSAEVQREEDGWRSAVAAFLMAQKKAAMLTDLGMKCPRPAALQHQPGNFALRDVLARDPQHRFDLIGSSPQFAVRLHVHAGGQLSEAEARAMEMEEEEWRGKLAAALARRPEGMLLSGLMHEVARPPMHQNTPIKDAIRRDPHQRFEMFGHGQALSARLTPGGHASLARYGGGYGGGYGAPPQHAQQHYAHPNQHGAPTGRGAAGPGQVGAIGLPPGITQAEADVLEEQWKVKIFDFLKGHDDPVPMAKLGAAIIRPKQLNSARYNMKDCLSRDTLRRFELVGENPRMAVRLSPYARTPHPRSAQFAEAARGYGEGAGAYPVQTQKERDRRTCYKCGEEGHISRDCPMQEIMSYGHTSMEQQEVEWRNRLDRKLGKKHYVLLSTLGLQVARPPLHPSTPLMDVLARDPLKRFIVFGDGPSMAVRRTGTDAPVVSVPKSLAQFQAKQEEEEAYRARLAEYLKSNEAEHGPLMLTEIGQHFERPAIKLNLKLLLQSDPKQRFELVGEAPRHSVRLRKSEKEEERDQEDLEEDWRHRLDLYLANKPQESLATLQEKIKRPDMLSSRTTLKHLLQFDPFQRFELTGQNNQTLTVRKRPGTPMPTEGGSKEIGRLRREAEEGGIEGMVKGVMRMLVVAVQVSLGGLGGGEEDLYEEDDEEDDDDDEWEEQGGWTSMPSVVSWSGVVRYAPTVGVRSAQKNGDGRLPFTSLPSVVSWAGVVTSSAVGAQGTGTHKGLAGHWTSMPSCVSWAGVASPARHLGAAGAAAARLGGPARPSREVVWANMPSVVSWVRA